jgi:hypothetical protein
LRHGSVSTRNRSEALPILVNISQKGIEVVIPCQDTEIQLLLDNPLYREENFEDDACVFPSDL